MFLSRETQYTIQAMIYIGLYGKKDVPLHSSEIAEKLQLPHQFMLKGLMALVRAGILNSQRGKGGGFCLARPANEIALYDIATATGETLKFTERCVLGYPECSHNVPCPFHHQIRGMVDGFLKGLKTTTLDKLTDDPEKIEAIIRRL